MANIGIYKITNKLNGKVYIGQSLNIFKRWGVHGNINKANNKKQVISKAVEKYGVENFIFEILERCKKEDLNGREAYWVKTYDSYKKGYNCTPGGDSFDEFRHTKIEKNTINLIYSQLLDNKLQIVELAEMYNVGESAIRAINTGDTWYNPNLMYPLRQGSTVYYSTLVKKDNLCKTCGIKISPKAKNCVNCIAKVKVRPNRNILFFMICKSSFSAVSKKLGVSDNAVRKWCKRYKLPHTVKGVNSLRWSARRDSNSHYATVAG